MKKLRSVLVDDMDHCIVTGSPVVEIHHVFNGPNRSLSEQYGFLVPLRPDWHNMTRYSVHMDQKLDESLKRRARDTMKPITGTGSISSWNLANRIYDPYRKMERREDKTP